MASSESNTHDLEQARRSVDQAQAIVHGLLMNWTADTPPEARGELAKAFEALDTVDRTLRVTIPGVLNADKQERALIAWGALFQYLQGTANTLQAIPDLVASTSADVEEVLKVLCRGLDMGTLTGDACPLMGLDTLVRLLGVDPNWQNYQDALEAKHEREAEAHHD